MLFGDRADIKGADDSSHVFGSLDGGKAGGSCSDYKDFGGGVLSRQRSLGQQRNMCSKNEGKL